MNKATITHISKVRQPIRVDPNVQLPFLMSAMIVMLEHHFDSLGPFLSKWLVHGRQGFKEIGLPSDQVDLLFDTLHSNYRLWVKRQKEQKMGIGDYSDEATSWLKRNKKFVLGVCVGIAVCVLIAALWTF